MTRRGILGALGTSMAMCAAPLVPGPAAGSSPQTGDPKPYDLLVKGGKVIDPSQGLEAQLDVAVRGGKIASVAPAIPEGQAAQVIRAQGKIVTPGLIDVHTHVFPYVGPYGIEPDPYCVRRGVTSVIDAGTSGAFTFPAFRRFIIERSATRIRALLHVVSIGMVAGGTPNMGELEDLRYCVPKLAVETANQNRDLIVGFKIRFSKNYTGPNDVEGMRRARAAADEAGLPIMIHIGGSYSPLNDFLALMKKGDVVTHSFNSHPHGLLDASGKLTPEVVNARQRGVLFERRARGGELFLRGDGEVPGTGFRAGHHFQRPVLGEHHRARLRPVNNPSQVSGPGNESAQRHRARHRQCCASFQLWRRDRHSQARRRGGCERAGLERRRVHLHRL